MKNRCLALWCLFVSVSVSVVAGVTTFPATGWQGLHPERGERSIRLVDAKGRPLATLTATKDFPSVADVKVDVESDGLVIDASAALRKGLKALVLRVPVESSAWAGQACTHLAEWSGETGAEMNLYYEYLDDGRHRYAMRSCTFAGRRRSFAQAAVVGDAPRSFSLRYDLVKFGSTGRFKFFQAQIAPCTELRPARPILPTGRPELTFYAAFDGSATATTSKGASEPVKLEGVSFVPGKRGMAVTLASAAKSCLSYAAEGNVSTASGTVSLWVRYMGADDTKWRSMLAFPESGKTCGNGQVWFWFWERLLRFDAADDGRHWGRLASVADADWHHYALAWDDRQYKIYVDGVCQYDSEIHALGDGASPLTKALKGEMFGHYLYDRVIPKEFFVGCRKRNNQIEGAIDEFKIWNGPLTEQEVQTEFLRLGQLQKKEKPDYRKLFSDAVQNPVEKASGTVAADLDLELVETIPLNRENVEKLTATKRFRSVGEVSYGTLNGIDYLACGSRKNDRVAVRFEVDPAFPLYVIDIDYPDDAKRTADIVVQGLTPAKAAGQTGPDYALQVGYFCGDECPNSNRMQTHRCLYWTCERDCALILMTARAEVPAAASAIRIYRVRDGKLPTLPVVEPPQKEGWGRTFALYYEDPAIGYDFATRRTSGHDLDELSAMIDRTAAYMKYCGQNLFCYPGVWYQGRIGEGGYNPRNHAEDYLSAWYEKFDREGLFLVPNVNPNNLRVPPTLVTPTSYLDGSLNDSPIAIHETGKANPGGWHNTPPNFCFLHPDVQAFIERQVDALVAQGVTHPSFKGICLHLTMHCFLWWGDIRSGYNDYVIDRFERDTGITVKRGTGALRARETAAWIRAQAEAAWIQWRCDQVTKFYARMAAKLRAARPDLKLWFNSFIQPDFRQADFMEPDFMERQARGAGLDRVALARIPNVILCQTAYPAFVRKRDREAFPTDASYAYNRVLQQQKGYNTLLDGAAYPWVQLFDLYWENPTGREKNGLSCEWMKECSWRVTTINPGGVYALRDFVVPLRHRDVLGFSKGGYLVGTYGMEVQLRRFMAAFRALPAVPMQEVAGVGDERVRVRDVEYEGRRYFYIVNTDCRARTVSLPWAGTSRDLVTGERFKDRLEFVLEPYGLRSFKMENQLNK